MTLEHHLRTLETSDLVRVGQLEPELEYLFKHALVQDAAYSSLLKQDRKALHKEVAEILEALNPDRLNELAPILAHHFDRAEESQKALHYYTRAADLAAARFASTEAAMNYSRALDFARALDDGDQLRTLYERLGHTLYHAGRHEAARDHYKAMVAEAKQRGDKRMELMALIDATTLHSNFTAVHDLDAATQFSKQAEALAHETGDRQAEAAVLWNRMHIARALGKAAEAVSFGERSAAIAREMNFKEQLAYALNDMAAHGLADLGEFRRALESLEEANGLWVELDDMGMLTDCLNTRAMMHAFVGEFDRSLELSGEARRIAIETNNSWARAYSYWVKGDIEALRGQIDEALESYHSAMSLGQDAGFMAAVISQGCSLALLYGVLGMPERGLETARLAEQRSAESFPVFRRWALIACARLQAQMGQIEGAQKCATLADSLESMAFVYVFVFRPLVGVEIALAQQDIPAALAALQPVLDYLEHSQADMYWPDTLLTAGRVYEQAGRAADARAAYERALAISRKTTARRTEWRALAALAELDEQDGDTSQAVERRAEAKKIITTIRDHISDAEMRKAFLAQPEVRRIME